MYPPLGSLFSSAKEPEDVAAIALDSALELTGRPRGNVQLARWAETGGLEIVAQRGFEEEFLTCFRRVSIRDTCVCGRALIQRSAVTVDDVRTDLALYRDIFDRAGVAPSNPFPCFPRAARWSACFASRRDRRAGKSCAAPCDRRTRTLAANAIIAIRASRRQAHQP